MIEPSFINSKFMDKMQGKTLFWAGAALMITLTVFVVVATKQKLGISPVTNSVTFEGEGKVLTRPDVAVTFFSIITSAGSSKEAQNQNSKKSKTVVDFLKKEGVEEKDLRTVGYDILPQYEPWLRPAPGIDVAPVQKGPPKIIGYQVAQGFEVKIRDLDKVGKILDGLISAGVDNVSNLRFEVGEPEKLKAEARIKAIADAKKKADDLKDQLGIKLGKIVNFYENVGGFPPPVFFETREAKGGFGGDGPSLPVGENEIKVNVGITYQIK